MACASEVLSLILIRYFNFSWLIYFYPEQDDIGCVAQGTQAIKIAETLAYSEVVREKYKHPYFLWDYANQTNLFAIEYQRFVWITTIFLRKTIACGREKPRGALHWLEWCLTLWGIAAHKNTLMPVRKHILSAWANFTTYLWCTLHLGPCLLHYNSIGHIIIFSSLTILRKYCTPC